MHSEKSFSAFCELFNCLGSDDHLDSENKGPPNDDTSLPEGKASTIIAETLEAILSEHGLDATIYIPSKLNGQNVFHAVLKSDLKDPEICCDYFSDGKKKKLKFSFEDVVDIRMGKAKSLGCFDVAIDALCLHIIVKPKWELTLSFISENLRNEILIGLRSLVQQRKEKR